MQRHLVGAQGKLTLVVGEFVPAINTTYTNMHFSGGFRLNGRVGVKLINCRVTGSPPPIGNAGYTVKGNSPGGSLDMERCTVITLANNTKGVVFNDTSTIRMVQCLILGGADAVSINPHNTNPALLFEGYSAVIRECFIGDLMDPDADPHSDAFQCDEGEGGILLERNRIEAFNIPPGTNPTNASANPASAEGGNAAIILTQDSGSPGQIGTVDVIDNYCDGGNYAVNTGPDDGLPPAGGQISGNRFGLRFNFGALVYGPNDTVEAGSNQWAWSGLAGLNDPEPVVVNTPVCPTC